MWEKGNIVETVCLLFHKSPDGHIIVTIEFGEGEGQEKNAVFPAQKYSCYVRDKAVIDTLSAVILGALAEVTGDDELKKLFKIRGHQYGDIFFNYAAQYVEKCNIEYLKAAPEKRKNKLRNIAKKFIQQPDSYKNMKRDLEYSAKQYGCSFRELHDPRLEYPEEINWCERRNSNTNHSCDSIRVILKISRKLHPCEMGGVHKTVTATVVCSAVAVLVYYPVM